MSETIRHFPRFLSLVRKGEYTGDAVILKSTFAKFEPSPHLRLHIDSISHETPDFSDIDFASFNQGSFGAAYSQFMRLHGLAPFRFSGQYKHLMAKNYLPVFYASVHDFFHVLTGYDTSLAGEAGVWGFVAGQDISPQSGRAYKMARVLYPLLKPRQRHLIRQAGAEGFRMGQQAKQILTMDFKSELSQPLDEVRRRFDIH